VLKKKIGKFKLKVNPYLRRGIFDIKQAEVKDENRREGRSIFSLVKRYFPKKGCW